MAAPMPWYNPSPYNPYYGQSRLAPSMSSAFIRPEIDIFQNLTPRLDYITNMVDKALTTGDIDEENLYQEVAKASVAINYPMADVNSDKLVSKQKALLAKYAKMMGDSSSLPKVKIKPEAAVTEEKTDGDRGGDTSKPVKQPPSTVKKAKVENNEDNSKDSFLNKFGLSSIKTLLRNNDFKTRLLDYINNEDFKEIKIEKKDNDDDNGDNKVDKKDS